MYSANGSQCQGSLRLVLMSVLPDFRAQEVLRSAHVCAAHPVACHALFLC